jgi:predicted transcriptional regulator
MKMANEKKIRKNVNVSRETEMWLMKRAEETGLSQSALVNLALVTYIDQQRALELMGNKSGMKELIEQLQKIQKENV